MGGRWGGGGCLFEAERLLNFSALRMGAYSRLGAYSNKYGMSIGEHRHCCVTFEI